MDLWVVAAAAGAGYLGKYWQNLSLSEKERLLLSSSSSSRISTRRSQESWNFLQQIRDRTCPLKRLSQEKALQGEVYDPFGGDDSVPDEVSASDVVRMAEHLNAQWLSSLPKFTAKETSCGFCSSKMQKSRLLLVSDDGVGDDHIVESFDLGLWYNMGESEVKPNHSSIDSCFSMDHATDSKEVSSQQSSDMLLFLIGLAIGMLSVESKRELQEMNEKLDQAMDLVQDLKEELDMKDNFSVKELSLSASEQEHSKNEMENLQLMSRVEAELEAELERLQMDMDMERERTSTFFQVNVQSSETITERGNYESDSESESNERWENYAVSPRELSIRLHELIESQLEERIQELEKALEINQNKESCVQIYD